jgi:hypothetical protein
MDKQVEEKDKKVVYYVQDVPELPYCSSISVPKLFPNCTRTVSDMQRYEARKGSPIPCPKGEIKVTDDVSNNPRMFGTFVPTRTGHTPIDFYQKIKYNLFKRQQIE